MKTITRRHIDLSNYEQKDLKMNTNDGSSLVMQCLGLNSQLYVQGKNAEAQEMITLSSISNDFVAPISSIIGDGIYTFDIVGIDNIELYCEGDAGDIYIKVVD